MRNQSSFFLDLRQRFMIGGLLAILGALLNGTIFLFYFHFPRIALERL